jgi:acyl-CoA synthetase (AMP-forming)/AMP-acid ligase II
VGDAVVLADTAGPTLYASLVAVLAAGATVVAVEPWLPVSRISPVVQQLRPRMFLGGSLGRAWAMAVPALRRINNRVHTADILGLPSGGRLEVAQVEAASAGIMSFTSGTTGKPKGVVRTHGNMEQQARCFSDCLNPDGLDGPDLCIFPNFALPNLVSGRTTVFVPRKWRAGDLRALDRLPSALAPVSLSCGPTFLVRLMELARVQSLRTINVLGATTDCWVLREGFVRWPDARWQHAYGSSEALPVARTDAREAVARSEQRGMHQVLCLGRPIEQIEHRLERDGVWVTGGSVCGEYFGNPEANRELKRRDGDGRIWHYMGDRVQADDGLWWYAGRSQQPLEDFQLEQRIFAHRRSSKCFVERDESGALHLYGVGVAREADELRLAFPELASVVELRELCYDRRHRARLDRKASMRRGTGAAAKWIDTARTWVNWLAG